MNNDMHVSHTIRTEAAAWVARLNAQDISQREREDFQRWLNISDDHQAAWQDMGYLNDEMAILGKTGTESNRVFTQGLEEVLAECAEMARRTEHHRSRLRVYQRIASIAAVLVVSLMAVVTILIAPWDNQEQTTTYKTAIGEQQTVMLEDGSSVMLNSDSELTAVISDSARRLHLKHGEAYFVVAKDANRPFVVAAKNSYVTALGTAFNIHNRGMQIRVTVLDGKVEVDPDATTATPGNDKPSRTLGKGSQIFYDYNQLSETRLLNEDDLTKTVSWRQGKLVFNNSTLEEIINEIQYYIPQKIVIANSELNHRKFGGAFAINNINSLLTAIEHGLDVEIVKKPGVIVLAKNYH